jgi:hypothetical protein
MSSGTVLTSASEPDAFAEASQMNGAQTNELRWRKSSRSGSQGGNCVEVAVAAGRWYVRDSKDPAGGVLRVDAAQWGAFLDTVRHGG